MQFFDSCSWFCGLVFVSTLRSIIINLNVILMPDLFPILKFSDIPSAYGMER